MIEYIYDIDGVVGLKLNYEDDNSLIMITQITKRIWRAQGTLLAKTRCQMAYVRREETPTTINQADEVDPKFYNKKYYNPEYHYKETGPEVLRLYTEKDNSHPKIDFTEVLDATYQNVLTIQHRSLVLNISTLFSFVLSSMPLNLNGLFIIPMKKDLFHLSSEENMP